MATSRGGQAVERAVQGARGKNVMLLRSCGSGTGARAVRSTGDPKRGWEKSHRWGLAPAVVALALGLGCGETESDPGEDQGSGGLTESCADGSEGCPCYGNGTCDRGLTCASRWCVLLPESGAGGGAGEGGEEVADAPEPEGG
ncbi:MAG TPA: hypothetical protein PLU22_17245, partial [Polyangiaceae bacterium]|nr:hypothetical protein [Polyangiaceae bacterium]